MTRIVASAAMTYAEYAVTARVYKDAYCDRWFNVVAILTVDGKRHATRRERVAGLYWARKTMTETLADMHGNY